MFAVIPIVAICSIGLLASVVKVVHDRFRAPEKIIPKMQQPNMDIVSSGSTDSHGKGSNTLIGGSVVATVVINGKSVTFVKDAAQLYGHYDLAIDFCVKNGR